MKLKTLILICLIIVLFGCNPAEKDIPETLIGNYYYKSGDEFWAYSLQKKFVIFDSQFWNFHKDFLAGAVLQIVSCPTKAKNFCFFKARHSS